MHHDGAILLHRQMQAAPAPCLQALAPSRDGLGVAVAGLFPWDGLADLCAAEGLAFVLGHALSLQALHGGQATQAQIDSQKMAGLLRGGRPPHASVSPAARRATRALVRRRTPLRRQRAALLAHGQHTHRPSPLPELGQTSADPTQRDGVAERLDAPAGPQPIAVALARLTSDDERRKALALSRLPTAKPHAAPTLSL